MVLDFTEPAKVGRSFGPPEVMPEVSDLEESVKSDDEGDDAEADTDVGPKDELAEKFSFLGDKFLAPFGHTKGPEAFLGYKVILIAYSATW